jgi:hypothetical protein
MQKLYYLTFLVAIILVGVFACQKPLPNNGVPFYISVDNASVAIDNPSVQGSASSKIDQIWVEIGSSNLGAYQLPVKFPVLSNEGTYDILIQAGIKNRGISGQLKTYPMLEAISQPITFNNTTKNYSINPVFRYLSRCNFEMNESFEFSNNFDVNMNITSDSNKYEGANSGMMELAPLNGAISKTGNLDIPNGSVAYIELNYKTDKPFSVGLLSNSLGSPVDMQLVVIDTKTTWNKMYIDITSDIANINSGTYQFYVKSYNDDSLSTKRVFIDNFKVIYL